MTREQSWLMILMLTMLATGGLLVFAGLWPVGAVLMALPLIAVWRLDR